VFLFTKFGFVPNPSEPGQIVVDGAQLISGKQSKGAYSVLASKRSTFTINIASIPTLPLKRPLVRSPILFVKAKYA
jgi:hypothetical protein